MSVQERVFGKNILVALGLWWCFSYLGGLVLWAWNSLFVYHRVFTGPSGDSLRIALSLPGYLIVGCLIGLGVAWFVDSAHISVWAGGLALLIALADARSWNVARRSGRSVPEATVIAIAIMGSIVTGCWLGSRWRERGVERGQVA
jgi:hypothetical protein